MSVGVEWLIDRRFPLKISDANPFDLTQTDRIEGVVI
jgi:hypothetical protein